MFAIPGNSGCSCTHTRALTCMHSHACPHMHALTCMPSHACTRMHSHACTHLFGFRLVEQVTVAQSPMVSLSPRVELPIGGDGCTVPAATRYLTYMFPLQGLNHLGTIIAPGGGGEKRGRWRRQEEAGRREVDEAGGRKEGEEKEEGRTSHFLRNSLFSLKVHVPHNY